MKNNEIENLNELLEQNKVYEVIDYVKKNNEIVNDYGDGLNTLLHYACMYKNTIQLIELIFIFDIVVDKKNQLGQTPLYFAVEVGDVNIIRLLLNKGFSLKEKDIFNLKPIDIIDNDIFVRVMESEF